MSWWMDDHGTEIVIDPDTGDIIVTTSESTGE